MRAMRAVPLVLPIAAALVSAIAGGLVRAGVPLEASPWLAQAVLNHAALMICAFMGTVIAVERAVALKRRAGWVGPIASASAGVALLAGASETGAWLLVAAAAAFVAVNIAIVRRQAAPHTFALLASALAWLAGNLAFATQVAPHTAIPFWFAFLVITIAAERLEMARLTRRRRGAQEALHIILALLLAGAAVSGIVFGAALVALAAWLFAFDIARRTVLGHGLTRYMAVCLLGGYAWLAVAGVAWIATTLGEPARDIALHALGLGFVVSMMMGHAPVILPAVAGIKVRFGNGFYLPLAALHLSLLARLVSRSDGALFNAFAIALFAATVVVAAIRGARAAPARPRPIR